VNVLREKDKMEGSKNSPFRMSENGIIRMRNIIYLLDNRDLKEEILKKAYESKLVIHQGSTKMYRYLKIFYWWLKMKNEIAEFMAKCALCQQVKIEHQILVDGLQPLPIPKWKWKYITMNFVTELSKSKKWNDAMGVIVVLPVKMMDSVDKLTRVYVNKVIRLNGIPISIVSDMDPRFTSKLWPSLQNAIGTRLKLSIT